MGFFPVAADGVTRMLQMQTFGVMVYMLGSFSCSLRSFWANDVWIGGIISQSNVCQEPAKYCIVKRKLMLFTQVVLMSWLNGAHYKWDSCKNIPQGQNKQTLKNMFMFSIQLLLNVTRKSNFQPHWVQLLPLKIRASVSIIFSGVRVDREANISDSGKQLWALILSCTAFL